jgi:hypothetical protein
MPNLIFFVTDVYAKKNFSPIRLKFRKKLEFFTTRNYFFRRILEIQPRLWATNGIKIDYICKNIQCRINNSQ